ncbi:MAG: hypothetical protein R2850_08315 [Bacteroidia bacterium]
MRSNDAQGNSWPAAQTIVSANYVGASAEMAVVDGFPAICFSSVITALPSLKYIRANDVNGTS